MKLTTKVPKPHSGLGTTPNVPVVVALAILIGAGAAYRFAAARYARSSENALVPPGALVPFPNALGEWLGRDLPLDEHVVQATDTDAHLNREYVRSTDGKPVLLWIGYGMRMRDLIPHRPEVCYPGAGWTLRDERSLTMPDHHGTVRECRLHRFTRGRPEAEAVTVVSWYIVDGVQTPDVALLRSRAWRPRARAGYALQVQICCNAAEWGGLADDELLAFASPVAAAIEELMAGIESDTLSGDHSTDVGSSATAEERGPQ